MGSIKHTQATNKRYGGRLGKITAPLNKKLQQVEWGEYRLGDLFEIEGNPQLNKDSFVFNKEGEYPYFTRTVFNNGILGYVEHLDEQHKIKGNCLAVGMIAMQFFYMQKDFYAGQFTKRAIPKSFALTQRVANYFISLLNKSQQIFQNALVRDFEPLFNNTIIQLPTKGGKIDFAFMESFIAELEAERIAELEAERIAELEAYLLATGLKDYTLTTEEQQALTDFENMEWGDYNITEVFTVKNSGNILSRDIVKDSGHTPYLCAGAENNAVSTYITYDEQYLDKGNCVFIGGKTFVVSYQEKDFYSNDSHNLILYLIDETLKNRYNHLYLATCVNKSLGHKYSWGDSISNKKIQTDKLKPPTHNNTPYFSQMELFIRAIEKLVIKEVVQYADRKIEATREVVER
ncbi:MAG: restriction endonuclease subunit S [Bacteroidales bacterium]